MSALKLAFVSPRVPSGSSVGGAETMLKHLAALTAELGHNVELLSTCATDHFSWKNDTEAGRRNVDGLDVTLFPVDENRDLEAFLSIQELMMKRRKVTIDEERTWLANGVNSQKLIQHLESNNYDLIIAGPYLFGLTVAALRSAGNRGILLSCLHDEPFAYLQSINHMFTNTRAVIFNTPSERDAARSIMSSIPERSAVIGLAVEQFDADPDAFRSRLPTSNQYLIYSGRREPMKGTPLMIDYLRTFRSRTGKDVHLVLTGKGHIDMEPGDSAWVHDVGFLSEEDKRNAMAGALAFCHPSTYESLGIVLLEAWMAGTPCLVHSGSSVLKDQCERSNGGLWFRCYPDFEEELSALLHNSELRDSMARAGREFVTTEYSRDAVKERLSRFLESVK